MQSCPFTATQRPVLLPNEILIQVQNDVGIYEGDVKLHEYQQGRLYLTSHRLVYVDSSKAACFEHGHIQRYETKPGFLTHSPKITLYLLPQPSTKTDDITWICTVCSESNRNTDKCHLCGIIQQLESRLLPSHKSCWKCTFDNHVDVKKCEMCGSSLDQPMPSTSIGSSVFRFSFRKGGMTEFAISLGTALAQKAWLSTDPTKLSPSKANLPLIGISGIVHQVDQSEKLAQETMSQAFTDLNALIQKAADMVKLAEAITAKLTPTSLDEPELASFREHLVHLGIENPVTRETAGDSYSEELARQLAEFLDKLPCDGVMTLVDIYCVFNRARGVALISPEDLYKSCCAFEQLGLGYRLRKFNSGLLCIQSDLFHDEIIIENIHRHIKLNATRGYSASSIAIDLKLSFSLAQEMLLLAEARGLLCRDDTIHGLLFYDNLFH